MELTKDLIEESAIHVTALRDAFLGFDGGSVEVKATIVESLEVAMCALVFFHDHVDDWQIGQNIYYVHYEEEFPDRSGVCKYRVTDVTASGLVQVEDEAPWYDPADPAERLFRTEEEAQAYLDSLRKEETDES